MLSNEQRAEHANRAIRVYEQVTQVEREYALKDLLASAMHWADEQGQDFEEALRVARMHYESEISEES